jgi:plastocyanin
VKEKAMQWKSIIVLVAFAALAVAACNSAEGAEPSDVTFDVELVEIKGATDGIPPPDIDPTTLSSGYGYKPPGEYDAENPAKFQVATYMFSPAAMSVITGDNVTLRMFGVNGDEHQMFIQAPDGSTVVEPFTINRGREVTVSFEADQSGHYKLICANHSPTMTADILSLSG